MLLTRYGFREWFIITAVAALVIAVAGFLAWMWLLLPDFRVTRGTTGRF